MSKYFKVKGKITTTKRLNMSVNGNPRFDIVVDGIILTSKSDYSYNYNIENLYKKQCEVIVKCYDTKNSTRIEGVTEIKK